MSSLHLIAFCLLATAAWLFALLGGNAEEVEPQSIGRCVKKIKEEKKLTICYYRGSVAANEALGRPKSSADSSWTKRTTAWFKGQFPGAEITEVDLALAGAGSELAAFRCPTDVLSTDPDLVFLEFAASDAGGKESRIQRGMEGVVRQILTSNPWAEIIFVHTTTKALAPGYAGGKVPQATAWHQQIARHYGLPEIDVGRSMVERIERGEGSWETLTLDGVHPGDAGVEVFAQSIEAYLEKHRSDAAVPAMVDLPDPLVEDPFVGAHLEDATLVRAPGWRKEEKPLGDGFPHYIAADKPGAELTFQFSGTTIGLLWMTAPDGGDIQWSIDGGAPQRLSSRAASSDGSPRAEHAILADDLRSGSHTLKIKILGAEKSPSRGTWIRIGAFLVHCDC